MVARSHSAAIVLAGTLGLAAMAACSSGTVGPVTQPGSTEPAPTSPGVTGANPPSNSEAPPAASASTPATSPTTDGPPPTGAPSAVATSSGPPPSGACGGSVLPGTYTVLCSGCHTATGTANSRYPDLYQFKGTIAAFTTQVRTGGGLMAAYSPTLISDADIASIFTYFTTSTRAGAKAISLGGIAPLFSPSDAVNPPIIFTRSTDNVLITRGAGRVRGRHEKQLSFAPFLENYFDNRTYGFIIEDWTPVGMQQIRLTYLPISMPDHDGNRITNLRSWKEQGNNATFESNRYAVDIMQAQIPATPPFTTPTAPYAFQQQAVETSGRTTSSRSAYSSYRARSSHPGPVIRTTRTRSVIRSASAASRRTIWITLPHRGQYPMRGSGAIRRSRGSSTMRDRPTRMPRSTCTSTNSRSTSRWRTSRTSSWGGGCSIPT